MVKIANNRPSGFSRTIGCPGSRRLLAKVPPRGPSSKYAELGSAAHDLVSRCLLNGTIPVEHMGEVIQRSEAWPVDKDMVRATSVMVEHCRKLINHPDTTKVLIETKLNIPLLDMPNGGTGDFISITGDTLHVVDYKHGAGVYVEEEGNAQFLSYAHGAVASIPTASRVVRNVAMTCVQPRCSGKPVRTWEIPLKELLAWRQNIAEPAVEISRRDDAPLIPGDWCGFCDAKGFCTAPMQATLEKMGSLG